MSLRAEDEGATEAEATETKQGAEQVKTTAPLSSGSKRPDVGTENQPSEENARQLSPEQIRENTAYAKHIAAAFGEIVGVFMRSKEFRKLTLGDLDHLVIPAVVSKQFIVAEAKSQRNGMVVPVATVLWAMVSEEVDRRLSTDLDKPVRLEAKDWKSGDIPWLIAAAGDKRVVSNMLHQLQSKVFKDRQIKFRSRDENGQTTVKFVGGE